MAKTQPPATRTSQQPRQRRLVWRWAFVMRTCNPPPGRVDVVSKWLVLLRACVFPLTITSAAVAGLLAVHEPGFDPWLFGLAGIGLLVAHGANNLMNDLFDLRTAVDTRSYPRALYAPHPVLSGLITRRGLARAAVAANAGSGVTRGRRTEPRTRSGITSRPLVSTSAARARDCTRISSVSAGEAATRTVASTSPSSPRLPSPRAS